MVSYQKGMFGTVPKATSFWSSHTLTCEFDFGLGTTTCKVTLLSTCHAVSTSNLDHGLSCLSHYLLNHLWLVPLSLIFFSRCSCADSRGPFKIPTQEDQLTLLADWPLPLTHFPLVVDVAEVGS